MPNIVGGFVVKNYPRGLQKEPRGNVRLAWPSPIHPFRGHSGPEVKLSDGHYHEVASLHVRIITKRASNSRNVPGGGGG